MKKTAISILCVMAITLVNAQKLKESAALEKFNLKPIESVIDEQGRKIDKETKALRINRNEYFKSDAKEASEIALFYLQAKRDVYGLNRNLDDIKVVNVQESLSGNYVYCRQYINDIPVFASNFTVYVNKEGIVRYTLNTFRNVTKYNEIPSNPLVNDSDALKCANKYLNIKGDIIGEPGIELVYFESIDKGLELAWKIYIISMDPYGAWQIFVSASDGRIVQAADISMSFDGSGEVFRPNPLVSADVPYGGNYVHNNGAANPYLDAQLAQVTLNDLTYENGLYRLKGAYCEVSDIEPPLGHLIPALTNPNNFNFSRNDLEFGAVMCYYYVDLSARRILQLGYPLPDGLKNFRIDPHGFDPQYDPRNASYVPIDATKPNSNYIRLGSDYPNGKTFVPACEDADVILHEYGHAIQWNLGPPNAPIYSILQQVGAVLEGSSDYWATSYKRYLYPNYWAAMCVWFEMDKPIVKRRTDSNMVLYPQQYVSAYSGSQIWSSALMKIWEDLGRDITDQLFIETHLHWYLTSSTMLQQHLCNRICICTTVTIYVKYILDFRNMA